jgi:hypothetical protein
MEAGVAVPARKDVSKSTQYRINRQRIFNILLAVLGSVLSHLAKVHEAESVLQPLPGPRVFALQLSGIGNVTHQLLQSQHMELDGPKWPPLIGISATIIFVTNRQDAVDKHASEAFLCVSRADIDVQVTDRVLRGHAIENINVGNAKDLESRGTHHLLSHLRWAYQDQERKLADFAGFEEIVDLFSMLQLATLWIQWRGCRVPVDKLGNLLCILRDSRTDVGTTRRRNSGNGLRISRNRKAGCCQWARVLIQWTGDEPSQECFSRSDSRLFWDSLMRQARSSLRACILLHRVYALASATVSRFDSHRLRSHDWDPLTGQV